VAAPDPCVAPRRDAPPAAAAVAVASAAAATAPAAALGCTPLTATAGTPAEVSARVPHPLREKRDQEAKEAASKRLPPLPAYGPVWIPAKLVPVGSRPWCRLPARQPQQPVQPQHRELSPQADEQQPHHNKEQPSGQQPGLPKEGKGAEMLEKQRPEPSRRVGAVGRRAKCGAAAVAPTVESSQSANAEVAGTPNEKQPIRRAPCAAAARPAQPALSHARPTGAFSPRDALPLWPVLWPASGESGRMVLTGCSVLRLQEPSTGLARLNAPVHQRERREGQLLRTQAAESADRSAG